MIRWYWRLYWLKLADFHAVIGFFNVIDTTALHVYSMTIWILNNLEWGASREATCEISGRTLHQIHVFYKPEQASHSPMLCDRQSWLPAFRLLINGRSTVRGWFATTMHSQRQEGKKNIVQMLHLLQHVCLTVRLLHSTQWSMKKE